MGDTKRIYIIRYIQGYIIHYQVQYSKKLVQKKLGLQKLKFDSFGGEIRKYRRFKEQSLSSIKPQYLEEQEAFVLRSYLSPDIKEEVEGVSEDAGEIWKQLDQKYGDEYKLIDSIMAEIKKVNSGPPGETLKMINTIEGT